MKLEYFSKDLADNGFGVLGETIFLYSMPPECRKGIMLNTDRSGVKYDWNLPHFFKCYLQVIDRAQNHADGELLAKQVSDYLQSSSERIYINTLGQPEMIVKFLLPQNLPIRYPRLDGNGIEWSINLETAYTMIP